MPGPNGVITVTGDMKRAKDCLQCGSTIADAQMVSVELDEYKKTANMSDLLTTKSSASEFSFQLTNNTKKLQDHLIDVAKTVNVAIGMDEK